MNGIINFLKPPGMTSAQAVAFIKRLTRHKAGHAGTLDPQAAGVLQIMLGKSTRLADYIMGSQKQYLAEICFSGSTDTQDATGRMLQAGTRTPSAEELAAVFPHFLGEVMQLPPQYSALKVGGQTAYAAARAGKTLDLQARQVRIDDIRLIRPMPGNRFLMRVRCGKGVYIRTLCHDLGEQLGIPAHMSWLLREQNGVFSISQAATPEDMIRWQEEGFPSNRPWFVHMMDVLVDYGHYEVDKGKTKHAINGVPLQLGDLTILKETIHTNQLLLFLSGKPLGLYQLSGLELKPVLMLWQVAAP